MKAIVFVLAVFLWVGAVGQPPAALNTNNTVYNQQWFDNLYEMGVEVKNDSIYVKEEVIKLFTDSAYRSAAYPDNYNWPQALALLNKMELKKAFWHMINLYGKDSATNSFVIGTFIAYDSLVQMDKALLATYYTYGFADPRISRLKNNKPDIFRPDLLEQGLSRVKEIIAYIWFFREKNKPGAQSR